MTATDLKLPDFLVIGAFKSGTTSLMSYLAQHPRIFVPWLQEPNYFASPEFSLDVEGDTNPVRDTIGYGRARTQTLAQYAALFREAAPDSIVGESSPQYMRAPEACTRIREVLPDVKLIAVLRNPADRAFSDYSMFVRDGLESDDFATVIQRERRNAPGFHYVETGFYGRQLRPFFDQFPREQIRVHLYEDLANPLDLMHGLFDWFGIDRTYDPDVSDMRNVSGVPKNKIIATGYKMRRRLQPLLKPIMPTRVQRVLDRQLTRGLRREVLDGSSRQQLLDIYGDDILDLQQLIGRDLGHWLHPADSSPGEV